MLFWYFLCCGCEFVQGHVVCMSRPEVNFGLLFLRSYSFILYFEIGELTETCGLLSRLWTPAIPLSSVSNEPPNLHVFISSVLVYKCGTTLRFSLGVWGSNTSSHAWVAYNLANALSPQLDFWYDIMNF